jgi:hypothetical protein
MAGKRQAMCESALNVPLDGNNIVQYQLLHNIIESSGNIERAAQYIE